ncbi:MAG: leucine-rich repeat domain-containing protein [Saccharofermentans sp.]|nr:leucine-rich repeat domain-containing protein [Saccharofermentans sp.]
MKFKRLLVPFVAVAMMASMMPAVVSAAEVEVKANDAAIAIEAKSESPEPYTGDCGKNLHFALQTNGTLLISGSGAMTNFGANKAPWAGYKDKIKAVAFSGKCTSIGNYAFYGCKNLASINIHTGITSIGTGAFYGSGITKAAGGASLKTIGTSAFKNCAKLTTVNITSKVLSKIGSQAFYGTPVTKITIAKTTKLTKKGVKNSLKGSKVKTVDVKNNKKVTYGAYFVKSNSGRKVSVK